VARRTVAPLNPARRLGLVEFARDLATIRRAAEDNEAVWERLREDEDLREKAQEILDHPEVEAVMEDEDLRRAIEARRIREILKNKNMQRLLKNKDVMGQLMELRPLVHEVALEVEAEQAEQDQE
jgi:hypothetical protein